MARGTGRAARGTEGDGMDMIIVTTLFPVLPLALRLVSVALIWSVQ